MITQTLLTSSGDAVDRSSYSTASISPSANKLVLVLVQHYCSGGNPPIPSVSGCGMTWQYITGITDSANIRRIDLFRSMSSSPSPGGLTFSFGSTQARCSWAISEFDGVDKTGSYGSGAIVQSSSAEASTGVGSLSITLSPIGSPINATFGAIRLGSLSTNINPGSGYTEITDYQDSENLHQTQWKIGTDNTVDWSWAPTGSTPAIALAIEIKGSGLNSVKKVAGVDIASVKKVAGVDISSVKKIVGLD